MLVLLVYPLHLHVNLRWETIFHDDLSTLVLHTLVETSLVARISIVHQSPKPNPQRQDSIALHIPPNTEQGECLFVAAFWRRGAGERASSRWLVVIYQQRRSVGARAL